MTAIPVQPRRWRWPAELTTPRKARQATNRLIAKWKLESIAVEIELMVSELIANACQYGGGPVTLILRRTDDGVRCEVGDADPLWPVYPSYPPEHGLGIVTSLASHVWVSAPPGGGKRVCFTLSEPETSR